jgi:hypothetical protein
MSTLVVPTGPLVGENDVTVGGGGGVTVNELELVPVPLSVLIEIGPVVAAAGTVAWISPPDSDVMLASAPLTLTPSRQEKFVPKMPTVVPGGPVEGVNEVIVGGG